MIKIALLFVPPGNASQPYTSLPALTAFMRREGYPVVQRDLSIEAVEDLLAEQRLAQAHRRVQIRLEGLERRATLSPEEEAEREALCRVAVGAEYVSRQIDAAKRTLRDPAGFYDFDRLAWAQNVVQRGRELLSADFYPSFWNETNVAMPRYDWSVADLLAATEDEAQNIFLSYFREVVVPSIAVEEPDLIGISITYSGQILPGFTLARQLQARCPEAHLCLGGAILSSMREELRHNPAIFALADSIVVSEGEHALLGLAQAVEHGTDLAAVPNLLYVDGGQVRATDLYLENVNELPAPDYRGLPLDLYLTPELTALLPTERGCYWKRCAFCTISTGMHAYRPRKIERVLADMKHLSQQLGTRCFFLANDAVPPARMRALAQAIHAEGLDFTWQTEARLEKSLTAETCRALAAGGCRRLMLGLESGAPRVLDLMDKGVTVEQAARAIHNCHDAGIAPHVFLILGFPTETRQEARETLSFVAAHRDAIQSLNYALFDLNGGSKVHRDPEHYGITRMEQPPADWLNGNVYTYAVTRGMNPETVLAEMYPEATEFFHRVLGFANASPRGLTGGVHPMTQYASWALLNYLDHYSATRLEELPLPPPAPRRIRQPALDRIARPTEGLLCRPLNGRAVVIFHPATGQVAILPTEAKSLMSLCDGQATLRQLASRQASSASDRGFVASYYLALTLCGELLARRYLTVEGADQAVGGGR